jgi:hypothetical protein
MFRVVTKGFDESFDRWTDALEAGNKLRPKCRSLLQDIRITEQGNVVWVYSRSHAHPMYFGAGTYDRLARLFLLENAAEIEVEDT